MNWSEEEFNRHQERVKSGAKAPKKTSTQKLQALGRLEKGTMNATEAKFAQYLDLQKHAGKVLWWKFEAIKLMIAKNTSITVDFAIMTDECHLVMIDVKGAKAIVTDDFRAKAKVAAKEFPFAFRVAYPKPKGETGWVFEEIVG